MSQFTNPYPLGPYNPDTHARINAEVPKEWYNNIRAMVPTGGIQTTVNILWYKLEQLCIEKGLTNVTDRTQFCELVSNLILVDGRTGISRGSASGTLPSANEPHDGGTKKSKSNGDKRIKSQQSTLLPKSGGIIPTKRESAE